MESQYYKERLGFQPPHASNGHHGNGHLQHPYKSNVGYEENLHKFKGTMTSGYAGACWGATSRLTGCSAVHG